MSKEIDLDKPEENLGFLLWQTTMIWNRELNRDLSTIDLTHTQFALLSALQRLLKQSHTVTQKSIAEQSRTDTMMVSKVLRKLEKKGLIERKQHETDTRAKCVFLTPKGEKTFQNALKIASASNADYFGKLSDEVSFRKELQRIIK